MERLIPSKKDFGGITLAIILYDEENHIHSIDISLYKKLFEGNSAVSDILVKSDPNGVERAYVCFVPEVVQFFDDDISDYYGNWNGLMQDIAKEVFSDSYCGVSFCTSVKETTGNYNL